jgi:hypothetical protein
LQQFAAAEYFNIIDFAAPLECDEEDDHPSNMRGFRDGWIPQRVVSFIEVSPQGASWARQVAESKHNNMKFFMMDGF